MKHERLSQKDISNIRGKLLEPFYDKIEDIKQMTNKINCTLNTIGTTRKLQQEWPEAYNLYLESMNMEPEVEGNGCDQVESPRAELSQLKPTGND